MGSFLFKSNLLQLDYQNQTTMKNISQALMLLALIGFSFQSNSQVILNGGSFEPVFIPAAWNDVYYTVPSGKNLIITHLDAGAISINGSEILVNLSTVHVPLGAGTEVSTWFGYSIIGYLVDNDGFGVQIDDSEEEFTSEGGIEIYPNPTGDVASVFVDYQGTWDITVYNLNGQIVLESSVNTPVKTIDTNSLSSGTYIVSARAKRKLIGSSQLIVQ